MKFTLVRPCPNCPFRTDRPGFLCGSRAEDIVYGLFTQDQTFSCHKTTVPFDDDEGEMTNGPNDQHCAGALILLEHQGATNQMMRIMERLGFYDRNKLEMDAPVFDDPEAFVDHHREAMGG